MKTFYIVSIVLTLVLNINCKEKKSSVSGDNTFVLSVLADKKLVEDMTTAESISNSLSMVTDDFLEQTSTDSENSGINSQIQFDTGTGALSVSNIVLNCPIVGTATISGTSTINVQSKANWFNKTFEIQSTKRSISLAGCKSALFTYNTNPGSNITIEQIGSGNWTSQTPGTSVTPGTTVSRTISNFTTTIKGSFKVENYKGGKADVVLDLTERIIKRTRTYTIPTVGSLSNGVLTYREGNISGKVIINGKEFTINRNLDIKSN